MLNRLLRTIIPNKLLKEADEKEETTRTILALNKQARRQAEASMIKSYKEMGVAIERHTWRE